MLGVVPVPGTGTGTDIKIRTLKGNAERNGYRIMNGNVERERLDRNIVTSSSGTRSFTSTYGDLYSINSRYFL